MKMHTENAEPGKCRTENTNNEFHVGLWLRRNVNCITVIICPPVCLYSEAIVIS